MVHFMSTPVCDGPHIPLSMQVILSVLSELLVLSILGGTAVYLGFLVVLSFGLLRLRRPPLAGKPSVSVVVPMHNEAENVAGTLQALSVQDYPGEWEVVCVDDRSSDRTAEILREFIQRDPRFRMVQIDPAEPAVPSPKKRALALGMDAAQFEVLATTDADCLPPPHWISTLAGCFVDGVDLVQGPKHILGTWTASHRYQRLEMLAFVAAEAAGFALGKPFLASAPSLAYRAETYRSSGGFHGLEGLVSGDDDMLVHRMIKVGACPLYAMDPTASVGTHPANSWREVLNQRARWASNGSRYENPFYVALLLAIFLWWCWLLVGWIPWASGVVPGWSWWGVWAVKVPFDLVFMGLAAWRFERWNALTDYVWCLPLQVAIFVRSAVAGHLGWFRWTREADGG
jgi:cellulose synthase/poly-beta-1,6-N-acetylglucosamine synthase-like glycosyltransferase